MEPVFTRPAKTGGGGGYGDFEEISVRKTGATWDHFFMCCTIREWR